MSQIDTTAKPQEEGKAAAPIPITERTEGHRNIPKAIFIENVDAWVEKYNEDILF
jgi:hypothetical protein